MNNQQLFDLTVQVLEGEVLIDDLPEDVQDAVIMASYEMASDLAESEEDNEPFIQMAEILRPMYAEIMQEYEEQFALAVDAAIANGGTYLGYQTAELH